MGLEASHPGYCLDFLRQHKADTLYLVGDIVDGLRLRKTWKWGAVHDEFVRAVLEMAQSGTKVVYIPGNHDAFLRAYVGGDTGILQHVALQREAVHQTVDGRRLLVTHGDEYDGVIPIAPWMALLGDAVYNLSTILQNWLNLWRDRLGVPPWSLSAWLRNNSKRARAYIGAFEHAVCEGTRRQGYDGVVCGHIHQPAIAEEDGFTYMNCGDWIDNCTALVEHQNGRIELIRWFGGSCLLESVSVTRPEPFAPKICQA